MGEGVAMGPRNLCVVGWGLALALTVSPVRAQTQPQAPTIVVNDPAAQSSALRIQVPMGDAGEAVDVSTDGPCGELQRESCDRAGRSFLIAAAAYAVVCVVLALLLNRLFYRRNTFGYAANTLVPVGVFAVVATVLMGLDPARDPNFVACVACNEFRGAILLSGLAQWPRSVVLGALPVALLSFLGIIILNRRAT